MIVFLDDYVAQGALLAFSVAGIRIPDDVQVITLANKGLGPVWIKPVTRFEVDAAAEADAFATSFMVMGLDRVKEIIEGQGGTITLDDNPGGGTIFYITLPTVDDDAEVEEAIIIED